MVQSLDPDCKHLVDFDQDRRSGSCADGDWEIVGTDSQILQFRLKPGQKISSEPGTMVFSSYDVKPKAVFAGCCAGMSGEDLFKTEWTNEGTTDGYVGITGNMPNNILPVNLNEVGTIYCRLGSWVCSTGSKNIRLRLDIYRKASCLALCSGFAPLLMQSIDSKTPGKDIWCFLTGCGTILEQTIPAGKTVYVDPESIVAWNTGVSVEAALFGDCQTCCCQCCCTCSQGVSTGSPAMLKMTAETEAKVWLQSMPFEKLKRMFAQQQGHAGGGGDPGAGHAPA